MYSPSATPGQLSEHRQRALRGVAALCEAVDRPGSGSQVLHRALPILREVMGERVALDLRDPTATREPASAGVVAPLVGRGRCFGSLRANGFELDVSSAQAFASAAGRIIGTALAHCDEDQDAGARGDAAALTPALEHRLRSAVATIGVAASTLQTRGAELPPHVQDQLLVDIEANVAALKAAMNDATAHGPRAGHHG